MTDCTLKKTKPTKDTYPWRNPDLDQAPANLTDEEATETASGIDGEPNNQKLPKLNRPPTSEIFGNDSSHMEIGWARINDREGFKYGSDTSGLGQQAAGCIRLTAGLASTEQFRGNIPDVPVNPSATRDAAMVYISQNSNVDLEFKCSGINVENRSCVVTKADEVRCIARSTVKIISGDDTANSKGRPIRSVGNIEFIGGNVPTLDEQGALKLLPVVRTNAIKGLPTGQKVTFNVLQPVPRGELLVAALDEIVDRIAKLSDTMYTMWESQARFNNAVKDHAHYEVANMCLSQLATGGPTNLNGGKCFPSAECMVEGQMTAVKQIATQAKECSAFHVTLEAIRHTYLSTGSDKSILSRQVKTT